MKSFMQSVLQKTSKLHQLSGELQKNFDDPKAAQTFVCMYISDVPMGFDSSKQVLAFDFSWPSLVSFSPDPSKGSEGPRGEVRRYGNRI